MTKDLKNINKLYYFLMKMEIHPSKLLILLYKIKKLN